MIITDGSTNQGGFEGGVFHGGESQLLPMPKATFFGSANCVHGMQDSNENDRYRAIHNIYDIEGGYIYVTTSHFIYANKNGVIKWLVSAPAGNTFLPNSISPCIIHKVGNKTYGVGYLKSGGGYKYFKVDLSTRAITVGVELYNGIDISFGILENNTIYHTFSYSNDNIQSYFIDIDTLKRTSRTYAGVGKKYYSVNSATRALMSHGVSFFNGSLIVSGSSVSQTAQGSHTILSVLFAINSDLDTSISKLKKSHIRTINAVSHNMWVGQLFQVSKDLFVSFASRRIFSEFNLSYGAGIRYYTRSDLEGWISDCIFAETGFRIGGN